MNPLDRLHELAAKLGLSPKLFDPIVLAIAFLLVNLILGEPIDLTGIKLAAAGVILALVGHQAPPALGVEQKDLNIKAKQSAAGKRSAAKRRRN